MVGAKVANLKKGQRADRVDPPIGGSTTQAQAAKMVNVGQRSIERAVKASDYGTPELIAAVEQDRIPVSQAAQIASRPAIEQQAIVIKVNMGMKPVAAARAVQREALDDRVAALPEGAYRILYADPPWKYGDERALDGYTTNAAENSYPTMSLDELKAIELPAAADAVLFLWATAPLSPGALELGKAEQSQRTASRSPQAAATIRRSTRCISRAC